MMLVPTTREVALSVAVAMRETTGEAVFVGVNGIEILGKSLSVDVVDAVDAVDVSGGVEEANDVAIADDVETSLKVELLEAVKLGVALLGDPVEITEEYSSDAGTLID